MPQSRVGLFLLLGEWTSFYFWESRLPGIKWDGWTIVSTAMKLVFLVGLLLAVVFAGEADEKSLTKLLAAAPPGVGCRAVPADPSKDILQLEKKIGDFLKVVEPRLLIPNMIYRNRLLRTTPNPSPWLKQNPQSSTNPPQEEPPRSPPRRRKSRPPSSQPQPLQSKLRIIRIRVI